MAAGRTLRVTASYLLALGLIASLSVGTHVLVDTIVQQQEATAKVVNIAGRQRMLSQRIAGTALDVIITNNASTRINSISVKAHRRKLFCPVANVIVRSFLAVRPD